MFDFSGLLIPAVLFFMLGFLASVIRSDLKFPEGMSKGLTIYLLVGIGLFGGIELAKADLSEAIGSVVAAIALGFITPLIAYGILTMVGKVGRMDASAIAAHYGSVSAATFLTAVAFLEARHVNFESHTVIMLAIMESPAIIVGLFLASMSRRMLGLNGQSDDKHNSEGTFGHLLRDAFTNGGVVLLFGSMLIGMIATSNSLDKIMPFFSKQGIFMGVLSLFLLEMGMEAAKRIHEFRKIGFFLVGFGMVMPLVGAVIGLITGHYFLGLSVGGTTLVAVLAASASYIAVPPAMRMAVPEANPSLYLTLAIGVTFPFNVIIGIPLYYQAATWLFG